MTSETRTIGGLTLGALVLGAVLAPGEGRASSVGAELVSRRLNALPADAASLILTGREGGNLRAAALAYAAGDGVVGLVLELDGQSLLGAQAPPVIELEIFAYALSEEGAVRSHLAEIVRLDLDRQDDTGVLYAGGLRFSGRLDVVPGSYRIRLLARDRLRRHFALRELPVVVPGAEDEPRPGPLLMRAEGDGWLDVRHGRLETGKAARISALPVFESGGTVSARLAGGTASGGELRLGTRFLDGEGKPVAAGELSPVAEEVSQVRLQVPALPPGAYDLQLVAIGGDDGVATAPAQHVLVSAGGPSDGARSWIQLSRNVTPLGEGAGSAALELSGGHRRDSRVVGGTYREALEALAGGDWEQARAAVHGLETGVFEAVEDEPHLLLAQGEMTIVDRLAKERVESLVPLMVLHLELQRRYVEERRFPLAAHTDNLVSALAEIYAERSESDLGPGLAADVLASVGAYLQSAQLSVPARRMLERALTLDERSPFALLQIAVAHEGRGEYRPAVEYLRRLAQVRPESGEGRLRLALNLARLGEREEAARLLDRLIWSRTDPTIQVVAYQERARIELDGGRPGGAASLLSEAVGRYPESSRLQIQLAYALDRGGDSAGARRVASRLDTVLARPGASPRFLYGRAEVGDAAGRRGALESAAITRLPALAVALDRLPGGGR